MTGMFNALNIPTDKASNPGACQFGRTIENLDVVENIPEIIKELFGSSLTEKEQRNVGAWSEKA